jgi:expansin (peptidoglycan-binding protein)
MVAAISHVDYGNPDPLANPSGGPAAIYCGAYVEAYGPGGTVTVRIVDKCPDAGCQGGHLDLSREAFAKIANPALGIVPITWRVVSPAISGPIRYHFKDGSNQWWTAVQIRNHRNPIVKFEYLNDSGSWVEVTRVDYNYFVQTGPGMGPGPYSFRVTDSYGNVLTDSGIVGGDNVTRDGKGQFPVGP